MRYTRKAKGFRNKTLEKLKGELSKNPKKEMIGISLLVSTRTCKDLKDKK